MGKRKAQDGKHMKLAPAELFVLKNTYELDLIRTLLMLIKMDDFPKSKTKVYNRANF